MTCCISKLLLTRAVHRQQKHLDPLPPLCLLSLSLPLPLPVHQLALPPRLLPVHRAVSALHPGSSRQSDVHAHGQRPLSFDLPAPQSVPGPAKSASNSASNASCITAEAGIPATAAAATAAASTVLSLVEATHESNKTSLSASSEAMHSDEEQAGLLVGSRGQDALGLPSSCAGCFSAWVETCAMTGLGLDALSTALLELADGHSLALTTFCMPSTAICTDSPCSRLCASHLGPFLFYTSHNADCPMRPLIPTI